MDQPTPSQKQREAILAELASLTTIERGTLSEEYRQRPAPGGQGTIRNGPYYKHQCWENKRNRSRRVPAREVPLLRDELERGARFNQLVDQLASLAVAHSREQRACQLQRERESESGAKKNSAKKASGKGTAKPKRSSPKSRRVSREKESKA